jgi:hypothetical protein
MVNFKFAVPTFTVCPSLTCTYVQNMYHLDTETFSPTNKTINEFHADAQIIYCSSSAGIYDRFSFK